jgi:hypothetical protein
VELTASSVRSCLAPASSRSSRLAFGFSYANMPYKDYNLQQDENQGKTAKAKGIT